ncbi:MAG TPA: RIP metalloprotease RseP [Terriglobales bacterium]
MQVVITNILAVAFVLGIMVLVHEFGHYAVAKLCGVRVEVFSIGFGKRIFGFRRGDTDYRLSVLPLGGYVKMAGENPMEARTGDPGEFMSHPRWQRFLIAIAGPAMNILLAVGLLTGVYMAHYVHDASLDQPTQIGWVLNNSSAEKAGLREGDVITKLDNLQNPVWEDTLYKLMLSPGQPLTVTYRRGDHEYQTKLTPDTVGSNRIGDAGIRPYEQVTVDKADPELPAYKAGIRSGDVIIAVNNTPVHSLSTIHQALDEGKGAPMQVTARRNGQEMHFTVTPYLLTDPGDGEKAYRLGFTFATQQHVDKLPLVQALHRSLEQNKKFSLLIFELVQKMIEKKVSVRQMDGPIGIMKASGEAARQPGWIPLLTLMAAISLNLAIFNLFPIPILDGGVIMLLFIEGLMRRDISIQIKERIYQAAFVFLLLFAVMVIYNDILKSFA